MPLEHRDADGAGFAGPAVGRSFQHVHEGEREPALEFHELVPERHADGELFAAIRDDDARFSQVQVNEESGTVEWPGHVDLDPDVLYGAFEPEVGGPLPRRVIQSQR